MGNKLGARFESALVRALDMALDMGRRFDGVVV
jgi:hypothetical protein